MAVDEEHLNILYIQMCTINSVLLERDIIVQLRTGIDRAQLIIILTCLITEENEKLVGSNYFLSKVNDISSSSNENLL